MSLLDKPLTDEEIRQISKKPIASYSDLVRLLKNYNNLEKEVEQILEKLKKMEHRMIEAEKSREYMCAQAGSADARVEKIENFIFSKGVVHTYSSATKKSDSYYKIRAEDLRSLFDEGNS